ncbi:MAG: SpoIIE family protein phosphatase [Gemmatimonadaceae bacterium]|nr:SpoIIE family protein phosphatase [Gemmatimonadaceae bacterium]
MNRPMSAPPATVTTLRQLNKAMVVGRKEDTFAEQTNLLLAQHFLPYPIEDTQAALERLRKEKFDLVIVDAEAPGGGGPAFLKALRADAALRDLPVLARSPRDDAAALDQCLASGADDYLPREYGAAVLGRRMNAAIDRHRIKDSAAMRDEMRVARHIQRDFLPETLPSMAGLELQAALHPAKQVSGDFYDAFPLATGQLFFVVGDVCDKGVGAALFMALFRSLIRASADPEGGGATQVRNTATYAVSTAPDAETPAELLVRVAEFTNNYIARLHGRTNMFATVFMAIIDPQSGACTYLNAGHEPPLVVGAQGIVQEFRPTGPALGMMPDVPFGAVDSTLDHGHTLFAFTDGLVEARNPSGEEFGNARLRAMLQGKPGESATALVARFVNAVQLFGQQGDPHDDLTLLAATRL